MANLGKQTIIFDNLALIERVLMTEFNKWSGGIKHFERISNEDLEQLKTVGALDETMRQNNSPTIGELRRIANDFNKSAGVRVSFDGYLVDPARADSRISIDLMRMQVPKDLVTIDLESKFAAIAQSADTFDRLEDDGSIAYEMRWD